MQWTSFLSCLCLLIFTFGLHLSWYLTQGLVSQVVVPWISPQTPFPSWVHHLVHKATPEGVRCLVHLGCCRFFCHICHICSLLVSFVLVVITGSLPSTIKETQIRALKTLPVTPGLKVRAHNLDQLVEKAAILVSWISCGTLTSGCVLSSLQQSGINPLLHFALLLLAVITSLNNSSPEEVVAAQNNTARIRTTFPILTPFHFIQANRMIFAMRIRVPLL